MTFLKISSIFISLFLTSVSSQNRNSFQEILNPPPSNESALMARYVVNEADWAPVATTSTREDIKNFPFVNLKSISDGLKGKGNGVPYMFISPLSGTAKDLEKSKKVTLMVSLVQGSYCSDMGYDPMDPRCARITLSGEVKKIPEGDPEYETARNAVFARHEWLSHMPPDFFFAKLEIGTIDVIAEFGGAASVSVEEYFNVNENEWSEYIRRYQ